jgi:hypothetical protein
VKAQSTAATSHAGSARHRRGHRAIPQNIARLPPRVLAAGFMSFVPQKKSVSPMRVMNALTENRVRVIFMLVHNPVKKIKSNL